ncbi:cyclophilin-type peptidyl-prolyl cis-trans isomerase [Aspergillus luchuensis IFO 4308]|nr:cyclophilin-type peptidyl-prolyl cis-trans isomerase [Aspergillus luchuensis IFO 4308]
MSVLLETSLGDIVIDLLVDDSPKACENVQKNFTFQTGDPIGPDSSESDGGSSIWGLLQGPSQRTFPLQLPPKLKHDERGTVSMATVPSPNDPDLRIAASQFIITLGDNLDYLDGKAVIFGKVVEGFDVLEKVNEAFIDDRGRPLKDIRIRHTVILDDPFEDPEGLVEPPESPVPSKAQLATVRIADDEDLDDDMDEESMERLRREREARAQALTLEMVGDLPFAEVKPPENVLFVCKLNPVTQDEDLNLIFSRFGPILSCEVIRDKRTGDSLQYAFIEFENQKDCEQAYFKMQGVLIDDHRIHVDFSQSVSKLSESWRNATITKRSGQRGGFGGVAGLEKKRQYRATENTRQRDDDYHMVFDKNAPKARSNRDERSYSRSPPRKSQRERRVSRSPRRDSYRNRYRDRSYSRSPPRRDSYGDRDRRHNDGERRRDRRDDDRYRERRRR